MILIEFRSCQTLLHHGCGEAWPGVPSSRVLYLESSFDGAANVKKKIVLVHFKSALNNRFCDIWRNTLAWSEHMCTYCPHVCVYRSEMLYCRCDHSQCRLNARRLWLRVPFPGGLACSRSLHVLLVSAYSGVLPHSRDMLTSCAQELSILNCLSVWLWMFVCLLVRVQLHLRLRAAGVENEWMDVIVGYISIPKWIYL